MVVSGDFDAFWTAYPNKVGKRDALKAFQQNVKVMPPIENVIAAIERQKTWDTWTRDGSKYIPHPASWIRAGRWDDQPATPLPAKPQGNCTPVTRYGQQPEYDGGADERAEAEVNRMIAREAKKAGITL